MEHRTGDLVSVLSWKGFCFVLRVQSIEGFRLARMSPCHAFNLKHKKPVVEFDFSRKSLLESSAFVVVICIYVYLSICRRVRIPFSDWQIEWLTSTFAIATGSKIVIWGL